MSVSNVSVVPTERTRQVALMMLKDAEQRSGADALLAHLHRIEQQQLPALVGVLLTNSKLNKKPGRQRLPLVYTEQQRRKANRQYRRGMRDDWTVAGWREYQRVAYQRRREHYSPTHIAERG